MRPPIAQLQACSLHSIGHVKQYAVFSLPQLLIVRILFSSKKHRSIIKNVVFYFNPVWDMGLLQTAHSSYDLTHALAEA